MIKQGFIKEIGEPRTFTDKDGNARHAYPVVCDFPYTTQNGRDATEGHHHAEPQVRTHPVLLCVAGQQGKEMATHQAEQHHTAA